MKPPVRNKVDFYDRFQAGEFGNRPRTWSNYAALQSDPYSGSVVIRYKDPNSPFLTYNVQQSELPSRLTRYVEVYGAEFIKFRFNEAMPDDHLLIQGELIDQPGGIHLHYSTAPHPMCEALRRYGKHASGLRAKHLLKANLDPDSYEWLYHLLDTYPEHTIEFSTYDRHVGLLEGHNTVWWEVRLY
jgi:hypothetical protein